jgi:hypothetical protein
VISEAKKLAQNELSLSQVKLIRTVMIIAGLVISYTSIVVPSDLLSLAMFLIGLGLVLWGCYLWAKVKGRNWAWMLFGLLAPIGLVVLLILPAKNPPPAPPSVPPPPPIT